MGVKEFKKYKLKPIIATLFIPIVVYLSYILFTLSIKENIISEYQSEYVKYTLIVYTFLFIFFIINKLVYDFKERIIVTEDYVIYVDIVNRIQLTKTNSTLVMKSRNLYVYEVEGTGTLVHIQLDEYSKELREHLSKTLG